LYSSGELDFGLAGHKFLAQMMTRRLPLGLSPPHKTHLKNPSFAMNSCYDKGEQRIAEVAFQYMYIARG